jgi:hypothetical protein
MIMPGMGGDEKKEKKKDSRAVETAQRNLQEGSAKAAGEDSYRKGGRVKRTGPAKLHKDEVVVHSRKTSRRTGRR